VTLTCVTSSERTGNSQRVPKPEGMGGSVGMQSRLRVVLPVARYLTLWGGSVKGLRGW